MTRIAAALAVLAACAGTLSGCGVRDERATAPRNAGWMHFVDGAVGVRGTYPADWHHARSITGFVDPREVLVLATYPLRGGAEAGECAPDHAVEDMTPGGAFIWLLEYRPVRGDPWAEVKPERFPPKPQSFDLGRAALEKGVSCFPGPGYSTTFRAADRPFQLLVAFGGDPTETRLAEVRDILDTLAFDELPPPPPDPYAGWPMVHAEPGDSLRTPPGWAAASARVEPGKTPRPRPIFFASNRPLSGLPSEQSLYEVLPSPFPEHAVVQDFPADGVLLWILEEQPGEASEGYEAMGPEWLRPDDFHPAEILTKANPEVRWLRARGSWYGYRFSLWVGSGPAATDRHLDLALKSAASLAVSGCMRDSLTECPDR